MKHFWGPFFAGFYCREGIFCFTLDYLYFIILYRFYCQKCNQRAEAYSEPNQTSKIKRFAKTDNDFKPLIIFAKASS